MFDINKFTLHTPSKEEIEQREKALYNENLLTPENFSLWFPNIELAILKTDTKMKYPSSAWHTLPYDWIKWLRSDNYSDEKIEEFNQYLLDTIPLSNGETYFIKTGNFSGKFNFENPKLEESNNIGRQFLNIFYESMLFGADMSNEIVVREYIESVDDIPTIYNGMPLHTEYRAFVMIDGNDSVLIDVVNYWHPTEMKRVYSEEDREVYESIKDKMISQFNKNKSFIGEEVLKISKSIKGLSGGWSIDVMQNGEDFYVIDAARMEVSALTEYIGLI